MLSEPRIPVSLQSEFMMGSSSGLPTSEMQSLGSPVVPFTFFWGSGFPCNVSNPNKGCRCHEMVAGLPRSRPLFIWYDYFSCPQQEGTGHGGNDPSNQELAIHSIPAYIEMCCCVVILCPPIIHRESQELLNKSSWSTRGWCRLVPGSSL